MPAAAVQGAGAACVPPPGLGTAHARVDAAAAELAHLHKGLPGLQKRAWKVHARIRRLSVLCGVVCRECLIRLPQEAFSERQILKVKNTNTRVNKGEPQPPPVEVVCTKCAAAIREDQNPPLVPYAGCFVTNADCLPIEGMAYYPDFFTEEDERRVLAICNANPWKTAIRRRQQFYGEVYYHTTRDNADVQPLDSNDDTLGLGEFDWLKERFESALWRSKVFGDTPFPTQILVNEYVGCNGIATHFEDEAAFGPVIATVSLLSPVLMSLQQPKDHNNHSMDLVAKTKVLLERRSLFVMAGDCRYKWRHGISRAATHIPLPGGGVAVRDESYHRISLTIRHLLDGRKRVAVSDRY